MHHIHVIYIYSIHVLPCENTVGKRGDESTPAAGSTVRARIVPTCGTCHPDDADQAIVPQ